MLLISTIIILALCYFIYTFLLKGISFFDLFNPAKLKGKIGENIVARMLHSNLPESKYTAIHNITLPAENGSTQIDHIVLSQHGIFVIETKNMKGWIFGSEKQESWTQKNFRKNTKFQNPLRQNYKHTQTLEKILKIDKKNIFSIVVFIGGSTFKTPMPENVVYGGKVIDYILSKQEKVLTQEQVYSLKTIIESEMFERSASTDRWHIRNVKEIKRQN